MKHLLGIVVFGLLFIIGTGAAVTTVRSSKPQSPPPAVSIVHPVNKDEGATPLIETRLADEEIRDGKSP